MGFWGKTTKIVSIAAIALGGVLAIGGAAMVGVSSNRTYKIDSVDPFNGTVTKVDVGIGFNNYADNFVLNVPGASVRAKMSYSDFLDFLKVSKIEAEIRLSNATDPAEKKMWTQTINVYNAAFQTYDIMVAGAVLLPIGSIMAILGVVFLILNIKKAKVAN